MGWLAGSSICASVGQGKTSHHQLFTLTWIPALEMKAQASLSLRILTHNIRYATSQPFRGEKPWAERKQLLLNELVYNTRHIDESFICLQEVLHVQLEDILGGLTQAAKAEEQWAYIGVGRDDGEKQGEYSPIIYQPVTWQLHHWETVWLSETPEKPSKSWDAASTRIVTIGVFRHRATGKFLLVLNTHLDDQGPRSRYEAARIILGKINGYLDGSYDETISGVVLAGDFNSQETQEAYQTLTAKESILVDSQKITKATEHYGNEITWTGFGYEDEPKSRIDYILLGPVDKSSDEPHHRWNSIGYAVLASRFDDGVWNSDHRAVVVDADLADPSI
ncbi:endonuclease/exonuclease/phosphatase family protein [Talaromyces stipitatus ATCC 10500]|uniref:Endonuclease/exonuclease/phosphatase family protein n=1 Tax=Talaromyces stipitatus (strain ATCC 10500 / CBS 375.48 / QM 6759 / NRRL 1006) TaxID=441959 RepID=B8MPX1_TALSN|nr:endonuclease/exonuclease/phosphatase family protein [Talaromyces stipitatus ATCC 10500]EED12861.1 endonuclease/exonuclease/phosphatase family protein [Talaromyces stipitatus ATCC 10500]